MVKKNWLFDWDGVVVNSEVTKKRGWKKLLAPYGVQDGDLFYTERIGKSGVVIGQEAINNYGLKGITAEELARGHADTFRELSRAGSPPIGSSVEFIRRLVADGARLVVVSSQHRDIIQHEIKSLGFVGCFAGIVSGVDDGLPAKPHPASYEFGAAMLGASPGECAAVEDTDPGLAAAKAAGIGFIVGFRNPESGPQKLDLADIVVEDLNELHRPH